MKLCEENGKTKKKKKKRSKQDESKENGDQEAQPASEEATEEGEDDPDDEDPADEQGAEQNAEQDAEGTNDGVSSEKEARRPRSGTCTGLRAIDTKIDIFDSMLLFHRPRNVDDARAGDCSNHSSERNIRLVQSQVVR